MFHEINQTLLLLIPPFLRLAKDLVKKQKKTQKKQTGERLVEGGGVASGRERVTRR